MFNNYFSKFIVYFCSFGQLYTIKNYDKNSTYKKFPNT